MINPVIAHSFVVHRASCRRSGTPCDLRIGKDIFPSNRTGRLDIENNEFNEIGYGTEGVEWGSPIDGRSDIALLKGHGVEEMDGVSDPRADSKGATHVSI
jgi:hypothetical protein